MGYRLRSTPRGIGAAIGTAIHRAAEITLREKAKSGSLPPSTVAADVAAVTLAEDLRQGEIAFDGPSGATHNRVEAEVQAVGMARAYHRVVAPQVEPLLVEERLEAEVAPGLVLSGQPDVVAREPERIRDLKSGARAGGSHTAQLGGYSLLARSNGIDIADAAVDFVRRVAVGKPQPDPVSSPVPIAPAELTAANVLAHIRRDLEVFREGDDATGTPPGRAEAFLANPNSILCSAKFCPAFGTEFCREGNPEKSNAV